MTIKSKESDLFIKILDISSIFPCINYYLELNYYNSTIHINKTKN